MLPDQRKHVVIVLPRGEAVRNFVYSQTLDALSRSGRVTVLSVVDDDAFRGRIGSRCAAVYPLREYPTHAAVSYLRALLDTAHDRWLGSAVAKNRSQMRDREARQQSIVARGRRWLLKSGAGLCANRYCLEGLSGLEKAASWSTRPTDAFADLFRELKPDLVFNGSHIHGPASDLPMLTASMMGIPTAGFIFSWDNLTSRSRIFRRYDSYLVWHDFMKNQLLELYRRIDPDRVFVTGTPQFDFHFQPEFWLDRDELCRRIGADPSRPFVLYTTGIDRHFPEEHRTVEAVAEILGRLEGLGRPQLVVRTYAKGTSPEMHSLRKRGLPGVVFPPTLWDERWYTPAYEDLAIYTSLLRQAALGINAASTVSLELLMHDKPVINLGFDPPGSRLDPMYGFARHIDFDHFRPVAASGATMVARSLDDMERMLRRGLSEPECDGEKRRRLIREMFGSMLDGRAGERVAGVLLRLAGGDLSVRKSFPASTADPADAAQSLGRR